MTLGDLLGGLKDRAVGMLTPSAPPSPTTLNLPQLQAAYQRYVIDAQSQGQQPMSFKDWLVQQQVSQ